MKDDQRVTLTKRLLKEGLFRLLQTKSIDKITVTELCCESGINRATFYRHFEQPRDIMNEMQRDIFRDIKRVCESSDVKKDALKSLEAICTYVYEKAEIVKIMFECRADAEFLRSINELFESLYRQRGIGRDRWPDDESAILAAYYYAGGIHYILRRWLVEPMKKTPEEMAALIYRLLNEPGAKKQ